jgi:hypothetical protein
MDEAAVPPSYGGADRERYVLGGHMLRRYKVMHIEVK